MQVTLLGNISSVKVAKIKLGDSDTERGTGTVSHNRLESKLVQFWRKAIWLYQNVIALNSARDLPYVCSWKITPKFYKDICCTLFEFQEWKHLKINEG